METQAQGVRAAGALVAAFGAGAAAAVGRGATGNAVGAISSFDARVCCAGNTPVERPDTNTWKACGSDTSTVSPGDWGRR